MLINVCFDTQLIRVIAHINQLIDQLINHILHHPSFQKLEASWRGLNYLVADIPRAQRSSVRVRMLTLSESELQSDCCGDDVEASILFNKIYTQEYDHPGGLPYSILLCDYTVTFNNTIDWLAILTTLSQIAAASFTALLLSVSAEFFELDTYHDLVDGINFDRSFSQSRYDKWHALRTREDMRHVHLILPRIIWRKPYNTINQNCVNSGFIEKIGSHNDYCWGSPCYLTALMIISCFKQTGWFTDIRAQSLPFEPLYISSDTSKLWPQSRVEASISDSLEQQLSQHGFTAVMEEPYSYLLTHRSCQAIAVVKSYDNPIAQLNAEVSILLPYMLCACRFAHYIKIVARDKVGSFISAPECEQLLQAWIYRYCGHVSQDSVSQLVKYPLSEAKIRVMEAEDNPGHYMCKIQIKPNYHIEKINTKLHFISYFPKKEVV